MNSKYQDWEHVVLAGAEGGVTGTDILGPYWLPGAPWKKELCAQPTLWLSGTVKGVDGEPVVGAVLDFWQADEKGEYDMEGFKFRGKVNSHEKGEWSLATVEPGCYLIREGKWRCPHIHVIVEAIGFKSLVTQLYFAGADHDAEDQWYKADRCVTFTSSGHANFDFVIAKE